VLVGIPRHAQLVGRQGQELPTELPSEWPACRKPVFMTKLADYGVATFRMTEAEIARDAENA
jgi:hypothetical protein